MIDTNFQVQRLQEQQPQERNLQQAVAAVAEPQVEWVIWNLEVNLAEWTLEAAEQM